MKRDGLHSFVIGIVMWVVLAFAIAWGLQAVIGIWPESGKAWIFILLLAPVIWIFFDAIGNALISAVDFLLPKVRYVNPQAAEKIAQEEKAQSSEAARWAFYILRVVIGLCVIYIVWQWVDHKLELPDRSSVVESTRYWWSHNFK